MNYTSRIRGAFQRYGYRALVVLLHRILFEWPRFRSTITRTKIKLLLDSEIGWGVVFGHDVTISVPGGYLAIGGGTYIGDRCVFEISANPRAEVRIGKSCFLAHDVHLGAYGAINIGSNVRIAEFTSIRDTSHNYRDPSRNINAQGDTVGSIIIEDDVWIGKGCLIMGSIEGTLIGKGAVIGAHSIVKASLPDFAIAVGAPATIVGYRGHADRR
jgi:serine acetyltransferase